MFSIVLFICYSLFFFFQAEDGIRDAQESRGLGDVYKRQTTHSRAMAPTHIQTGTEKTLLLDCLTGPNAEWWKCSPKVGWEGHLSWFDMSSAVQDSRAKSGSASSLPNLSLIHI
eukprot:TRINITY_DN65050_c0_g1_i1.p1 TRINITY_DN65050_c0_g1~~TRINITY_DN65050_c0_g1_i1.p1  ORF type:complete len:114 (+),score=20.34 TRINITY_DN65050_c0_g1_i1:19-360(+)